MTAITEAAMVAVEKNAGDPEVLVNVYGTYTGFAFTFEWSPDGANGWAPLAVKDVGTGQLVTGSIAPANSASKGWRVPADDFFVRMNVTAIASGTVNANFKSTSTSPQMPIVIAQAVSPNGFAVANAAVSTVGAATLAAADIVGGVITRTGSTAAYSDTTDTAVAIIAAITDAVTGQTWILTIKNNVNFTQTLIGGVDVTLSGQTKIPPNCTGTFLMTVASGTTVTMQGLQITENNPIPNSKYTSVNAATGSLAAGVATGARNVYVLNVHATPGAQLVRTAAQMLADIPGGVIGMTWRLVITNSGAGAFTLTTDAGTTVTLTGNMVIPRNSTREFQVTIDTAITATVQAVGSLTDPALTVATALTTAGAGTITAAGIVGGVTNRSGPTAAFIDTSDTGTAINAALRVASVGQSWEWTYINTTNFVGTLANGAGFTFTGVTVPPNTWACFLVTLTAANTITAVQIASGPTGVNNAIVADIVSQGAPTAETGVATISIADILTGIVTLSHSTGATVALTLDTGEAMDIGKPATVGVDLAIDWTIINLSAAALDTGTLTAAVGHTIVGNPIVQSAHATTGGITGNSARFRSRRTAADTWVSYRLS